jgi:hypothetical protein
MVTDVIVTQRLPFKKPQLKLQFECHQFYFSSVFLHRLEGKRAITVKKQHRTPAQQLQFSFENSFQNSIRCQHITCGTFALAV